MKTFFPFLLLLVFTIHSNCQGVTTDGNLNPSSNTDNYTITEKTDQNKIIERLFTDKKTGKAVLKYSRKDDSTFVYTEYDSNGKEFRKGTLGQNNSKAMHYKIVKPDLEKDPELTLGIVKDSIIYDDYFDRHGLWRETINQQTWEGNYDHEQKTGVWKRVRIAGAATENDPDSIVVYQDGTPTSDTYTSLSENQLFELLKGKWFADTGNSGKTYQFMHRTPIGGNVTEYLRFNAPGEVEFVSKQGAEKAKWSFKNNQLIVEMAGHSTTIAIIYLNTETLVVQNLSN